MSRLPTRGLLARVFSLAVVLVFATSQCVYAFDANLSSSQSTVPASSLPAFKPVGIMVGGRVHSVSASSMLTPAEATAVMQVMQAGRQTLVVGSNGAATGGHFMVNSDLGSLVIPSGVAAYDRLTNLNITRNLTNAGALYAVPANLSVNTATINAQSIFNLASGLISTILPKNAPVVGREQLNLALNIGSGTLVNSGVIESSGSITIGATSSTTDVHVVASGGTFRALNGDINIRDASYNGNANIYIQGGDFLSRNLNLYSGTGVIEAVAGQVTGNLNSIAGVEHFAADTENLVLHNNCISGDPTFVNRGGNIIISGVNTFSEAVAILASGNITADGTGAIIAHGFNVTLGAGLGLTVSDSSGANTASTTISGGTGTSQIAGGATVTANFATGSGGNIDLSASTASTVIDTTATSANGSGGNVTLAALGSGTTLGTITLSGAVNTYGSGTGSGGNVYVYAGATPASASTTITLGSVTTGGAGPSGSSSSNGTVNIYTAQPISTSGNTVTFNSSGTPTANSITNAASLSTDAKISLGAINTSGAGGNGGGNISSSTGKTGGKAGNITIQAGNAVTGTSLQAFGGGGGAGGGFGSGGAGGAGAAISVASGSGGITLTGIVNSSGGGGGAGALGSASGGSGGAAGGITLTTSGSLSVAGPILAAGGGNGTTGSFGAGGNGGGSFGGGGGGGAGQINGFGSNAGTGGSGTFGGGGGGGGLSAAGGGGGGFAGSGGGGAGDPNSSGGGGGGGGGTGSGSGGNFAGSSTGGSGGTGGGSGGNTTGPTTNGGNGGAGGTGGTGNGNGGGSIGGGTGGASGSTNSSFGTGGNRAGTGGAGGTVTLSGAGVSVTGTIGSGTFSGQSINAQGSGGNVSIISSNGNIGAMTIAAPAVTLYATSGNVGSSAASPVNVGNSGSGVSLRATATGAAQGNIWITDNSSSAENITINNSSFAISGDVSVTLTNNNGSIIASTAGNTAISAPTVSVTATNGNVAADSGGTSALLINSGGTSGLSLFAKATGAGAGKVNISDTNSESVSLLNSGTTPSAANSFTLSAVNNITAAATGNTAIGAPAISLTSTSGNIGSTATALIVSSGSSGAKQLTFTGSATANTSNNGNINISDADADVSGNPALLLGVTAAGSGTNASSGSGSLKVTTTTGGIGVNGDSTATRTLTLAAQTNITQVSGSVKAPTVQLTSTAGNIGTAPGTTSSNGAVVIGCDQCTMVGYSGFGIMNATVSATANTSGNGNIYVFNATSLRLQVGNSAAGTSPALDSSTGNMVIGSSGGVAVNGNITGSTSVSLNAGINVIQLIGSVNSPNISLSASTGRIGDSATPIAVSSGASGTTQLNLSATAATNSNNAGEIFITDNNSDIGAVPALLLNSITAGSGNPVGSSTGVIEITTTNGGIEVGGAVSGTTSIKLTAAGNILGSGTLSAPSMSLTSATGNIGGDSTASTALSVNSGGTSGLTIYSQGSTVNLADTNSESVLIDNSTTIPSATVSYTLSAQGSIRAKATGADAVSSPSISLTAIGGDIATSSSPLIIGNSGNDVLLYARATSVAGAGGNVWLTDLQSETVAFNNIVAPSSADSLFKLIAFGTIFASTAGNTAVSSPSIFLASLSGDLAANAGATAPLLFNSGGTSGVLLYASGDRVLLQNATNEPVTLNNSSGGLSIGTQFDLSTVGDITASTNGNPAVAAPGISLTTTSGGIGLPSNFFVVDENSDLAIDAQDGTSGSAYLQSTGTSLSLISTNIGNTLSLKFNGDASLSSLTGLNAPNLALSTLNGGNITLDVASFNATQSISLNAAGAILGNATFNSPGVSLVAANGDIGASNNPMLVTNGSSELILFAGASAGSVYLTNSDSGNVILDNGTGTPGAGATFNLSAVGDIIAGTNGNTAIGAPTISLTTSEGNIGESNGLLLSSGNTGTQLSLSVSAGANVSGKGNVYILDADADGALQTAMLLTSASAGSGIPVDNTTGNLQVRTTSGGITVGGTVTATTSVDLQANTNLYSNNAIVSAPVVSLSATNGGIVPLGLAAPLQFTATTLSVSAPSFSNGVVSLTSAGAAFALTSAIIGNSLSIAGPATINVPTPVAAQTINLVSTVGDINILSSMSVQKNLTLDANGTITTSDGFSLISPIISLTAGTSINNSALLLGQSPGLVFLTTPQLTNNEAITASSGQLHINAGSATNLVLTGTGTMSGDTVTIANTNSSGTIVFDAAAEQVVTTGDVTIFAPLGTITGNGSNNLTAVGTLTLTANVLTNPGDFTTTQNTVINFPANNFSNGTIVNTNGDVVLGAKTIVNANGKSIAILASGDVIASGLTQINLSNSKGNGGSLTVIAGYEILPASTPQGVDTSTLFTIGDPSLTGGSIDLPKVSINTSTSNGAGKPNTGGNIVMLAAGGSESAGNIVVGGLNTSSTNGYAGDITLLGQGGIVVNGNVKAAGKLGGGKLKIEARGLIFRTALQVQDGYLLSPPVTSLFNNNTAAAVNVKGAITTSSISGSGGEIAIGSSAQVAVTGAINSSGLLGGGSVSIFASGGPISVANVTTSALAVSSSSAAGNAGSILMVGTAVKTGTVLAVGGSNKSTGNGGQGGSLFLQTDPDINGILFGGITVKGFINTSGGTSKLGSAGNGGGVGLGAATVAVTGTTSGASIRTTGTQNGTVSIHTYSNQVIPDNFDLTSTTRSIPAMPGGMFTFGTANPVNGVAGTIVSDVTISKSTVGNNGQIDTTTTLSSKIKVTISPLSSFTIQEGASTLTITPVVALGGARVMLTPAEALAAYQYIRTGGTQSITLSQPVNAKSGGAATGTTAPVVLNLLDTKNSAFTAFKVPAGVELQFAGANPIINVPSKNLLAGDITFDAGSTAYINFGSVAFKNTGSIIAPMDATIILSGTARSWTNNGIIDAGQLLIARPTTSALTFTTGAGAQTMPGDGEIVMDPSFDSAINVSFKALGADWHTPNFSFAPFYLTTAYSANATAIATAAATNPAVSMKFALAVDNGGGLTVVPAVLTGSISGKSITLTAQSVRVGTTTVTPSLNIITSDISATNNVSITSADTVALFDTTITAGSTAQTFNPTGTIDKSQITSKGSILLTSTSTGTGTGVIVSDSILTAVGGNVQLKSTSTGTSSITLGTGIKFTALGGNILVLAKGDISGSVDLPARIFQAEGITGTASGGIEFSAGSITSKLSAAFSKPANTQPSNLTVLGPSVTDANVSNSNGVIVVNAGGTTDLNFMGGTPALTLNHGAIVFSTTSGHGISIPGGNYTTSSSKPIDFVDSDVDEVIVDTEFDY